MTSQESNSEPAASSAQDAAVETVLAALGRIRGRRGPRMGGPGGFGRGGFGSGGPGGFGGEGFGPGGFDPRRFGRGSERGMAGTHSADHDRQHHHHHPHDHAPDQPNDDPRLGRAEWMSGGGRLAGPARVRLLEALAAAPEPLTVSDVAIAVGVDQPRASRLIQQAVALGLVRREADPDDARRTRIALTDEGRKLAGGVRGHRHETIRTALDGLSEDERAEFLRLLTKFASAWPIE